MTDEQSDDSGVEGNPPQRSADEGEDDDGSTRSTRARWVYTNDLLAGALVAGYLSVVALTGVGVMDPAVLSTDAALAMYAYVGTAVAWAFGGAAIRAWRGK